MSIKLTKSFSLPKLKADGSNWILFQESLELETASHNLEKHIDGTGTAPITPPPVAGPPTADEQQAIDNYAGAFDKWSAGEATIRKGLAEALPPALYLIVQKEVTAKLVWDAVVNHHQHKAQLIIVELRQKLQNEKCDEKGDIRAHLSKL